MNICYTAEMASDFRRGMDESSAQFPALRGKWPIAFPAKPHDVRPLAVGALYEIAAAMGWSVAYTRGVLIPWKMGPAYCRAVLSHDQRIGLDGSPAETVDAEARELATKQLARLAARKAAKAKPNVPAKPAKPAKASRPETPKPLRDQVRAGLFRRKA